MQKHIHAVIDIRGLSALLPHHTLIKPELEMGHLEVSHFGFGFQTEGKKCILSQSFKLYL